MAPDAAADLLGEMDDDISEEILGEMEAEPKSEVSQLLKFGDNTAGGLMNTEAVLLPAKITVAGVWPVLVERQELLEELNTVFLTDDGRRVVAMVPLARLVLAADESRLEELATERLVSVTPEENLDKVFEPLFTTKAKGIGLGLAIVKTRVEEHEGSIEVKSEAGKGSVFTIKLPLMTKSEAAEE